MFTERNGGEKMVIVKDKEKLKRDIILAGFSITSLAKEVGCSKAHISSIVNHERNPSGTIAVKICEQIKGKFDDYFFIESVHKKELKR
jgi:DNA-binding helix-turn-helix protein